MRHRGVGETAECSRWKGVLPPVKDVGPGEEQRWVIHRSSTVYGLGDYLAGFLSAFVFAAATQSRFYVKHPFDASLVSFAPYDVPPTFDVVARARNKTVRTFNRCPTFEELDGAQIVVYQGLKKPANRACASSWHPHLASIWRALGSEGTTNPLEDRRATLVYGCLLRYFKPLPAITTRIPRVDGRRAVVAVHVRAGDLKFEVGDCEGREMTRFEDDVGDEILRVVESFGEAVRRRGVTFRIESDDFCARDAIADAIRRSAKSDAFEVAPAIVRPSHDVKDAADQLAAWFSLSRADAFIVSPMYHPREGVLPWFDKYFRVRGFVDHGLLRLSSWSVMAALRAGTDHFHVLCSKPRPKGMESLLRTHPNYEALLRPYECDSKRKSAVGLAAKMGFKHSPLPSENAHFLPPGTPNTSTIWWGVGTLA